MSLIHLYRASIDYKRSPGYALTLTSSSTTGVTHSAEATSSTFHSHPDTQATPEDLAISVAQALLAELVRGGAIDRGCEAMVLTLMAMGKEGDVVRCLLGSPLSSFL